MARRLLKRYWDTSVFAAVLKQERGHGPGVLEAAVEQMRQVESGELVIVSSHIIFAEILPGHYSPSVYDRLRGWLQREHVHLVAADQPVMLKAGALRNRCLQATPKVKLYTADAIHAATALLYQADEFHSLDDRLNAVFEHAEERLRASKPQQSQLILLPRTPSYLEEDDADDNEPDLQSG